MKIENKDKKLNQLHQLIEQFEYNEKIYKSGNYDEANTRVDFIDKFFEILDWDVRNTSGYSEAYRDVVREDKVIIKGKPKAPDYSFRIGGVRKFFVEAKRPSINIKEDIEPAFQIRRYSYTAKLPLSILTDFEEMAVYDTMIKPSKTDKASAARINYILYKKYPDEFDFIYSTFSKPAILKGSFDKYIEDTKRKRGTSEVDKEFLKMIDEWRTDLARNIALRNKQLDINDLNYAIQKIIDRIIFLRIAEDRQMESYGTLQIAGKSNLAYQKISHLFRKANDKYNSGLFKVESWLETLVVDDKIICSIINSLYYPECPYELSVMPIEILGNIYEQFLGKTIRLTPSHQAKIEEKPEVRKAGGVYYTPKYIVDYIVENTVGEKLKRKTPKQIEKLRILDPACGSGSFLVGAYQHLIDYHLKYYTKDKNSKNALKKGIIYQVDQNTFRLSIQEKQNILLNNIYGVDIDSQAVEVTKLSLLLKLMEDENIQSAGQLFKYSDLKLLPDLKDNIKCGNSLIGTDFYKDKQLELFSKDDIRKINAFDWEVEFRDIMDSGGFDCVIGNPPYLKLTNYTFNKVQLKYFNKKYLTIHGGSSKNLFQLFIEKVLVLKPKYFSFIVPEALLVTSSNNLLRKQMIKTMKINALGLFDKYVFLEANIGTVIFVLSLYRNDQTKIELLYENIEKELLKTVKLNKDGSPWETRIKEKNEVLLKKMDVISIELEKLTEMSKGMVVKDRKNFYELSKNDNNLPFLLGKNLSRYSIRYQYYINYNKITIVGGTRSLSKHLKIPRLLIRRTGSTLCASYSGDESLIESTLYMLFSDKVSLKILLGLINSKLLTFYLKQKLLTNIQGYPQVLMWQLQKLPIAKITEKNKGKSEKLEKLVEEILNNHETYNRYNNKSGQSIIMKRIQLIDNQINQLVYELYGLTDEEIKIVEGEIGK